MARQAGKIWITGTIGGLTYYKMEGKWYVRTKSSLTRKRFMRDASFERSRKSAERFAMGNKLASKLYHRVEKSKRAYKLFCFLKKRAIALLKEGKCVMQVEELLIDNLIEFGIVDRKQKKQEYKQRVTVKPVLKQGTHPPTITKLISLPARHLFVSVIKLHLSG